MILISHRGNISSKNLSIENRFNQIKLCLFEYKISVEIDLWYINNTFYLTHDPIFDNSSKEEANNLLEFIYNNPHYHSNLFVHCKNKDAFIKMQQNNRFKFLNLFMHEDDPFTVTTTGFIWAHPKSFQERKDSIFVDINNIINKNDREILGICTDHIERFL